MSMYAYVRNNPLRYTDPDGRTARWKVNTADLGLGGGYLPRSGRP
jgi:hypothetical protein